MRRSLGVFLLLSGLHTGCYTLLQHPEPADVELLQDEESLVDYSDCSACHLEVDPYLWYPTRFVYYQDWRGWPATGPWWWGSAGTPRAPGGRSTGTRHTQGSGLDNARWPRPIPPPVVPVNDPGVSRVGRTESDKDTGTRRGAEVTSPGGSGTTQHVEPERPPVSRNDETPPAQTPQPPRTRESEPAAPSPSAPSPSAPSASPTPPTPAAPAASPPPPGTPTTRGAGEALPNDRPRP